MNVVVYNFVPYRIIAITRLKDQILSDSVIWDFFDEGMLLSSDIRNFEFYSIRIENSQNEKNLAIFYALPRIGSCSTYLIWKLSLVVISPEMNKSLTVP